MVSKVASPSEKISGSVVSGYVQIAFSDALGLLNSRTCHDSEVKSSFSSWLLALVSFLSFFLTSTKPSGIFCHRFIPSTIFLGYRVMGNFRLGLSRRGCRFLVLTFSVQARFHLASCRQLFPKFR